MNSESNSTAAKAGNSKSCVLSGVVTFLLSNGLVVLVLGSLSQNPVSCIAGGAVCTVASVLHWYVCHKRRTGMPHLAAPRLA